MKTNSIKKYRLIIQLLLLLILSPMANALDGQGTIKEVVNCSSGQKPVDGRWKQMLLFRLSDDNWFGVYADYAKSSATDYDSNFAVSMVLMAFSSNLPIKVRANYKTLSFCGISAAMFWDKANDYIKIAK